MPCFYPEGPVADWCERHVKEAHIHVREDARASS